jgi:hypothetical protein
MGMFTAYFDEAGSPDDSLTLVVAGFISTAEQWEYFEQEWKEVLDEFGIGCFHMKDYVHNKNEFEGWGADEFKRRRFLQKLASVTACRVRRWFSCQVILENYKTLNRKYCCTEMLYYPYSLCGIGCIDAITTWANHYGHDWKEIVCVFEDGAKHKGKFIELIERDRKGVPLPIFRRKCDYGALQAADFIAWELRKMVTEVETRGNRRIRESLAALTKIPRSGGIFFGDGLERLLVASRVPLRSTFREPCP